MKDNSLLGNGDIIKILSKTTLSAEMISSVKELLKVLDNSRAEMIDVYKKVGDDKARRYDKEIDHLNELYKMEIEYLIRMAEKEDISPEQKEELSKKIAEKIIETKKVFDEIIAKANEESDKESAKVKEETVRSDKQKTESVGSIASVIAGATLILSGTTVVVKNPKDPKIGAYLILVGLGCLGIPETKKLLPLLQSEVDIFTKDKMNDGD